MSARARRRWRSSSKGGTEETVGIRAALPQDNSLGFKAIHRCEAALLECSESMRGGLCLRGPKREIPIWSCLSEDLTVGQDKVGLQMQPEPVRGFGAKMRTLAHAGAVHPSGRNGAENRPARLRQYAARRFPVAVAPPAPKLGGSGGAGKTKRGRRFTPSSVRNLRASLKLRPSRLPSSSTCVSAA